MYATVQYAECVAMQAWPDGARHLWNPDGVRVAIEPKLFDAPEGFLAPLDAAIPAERVVWQPARDPSQIPAHPLGARSNRMNERYSRQTVAARIARTLVRIVFWMFFVFAVLFTAVAIGMPFDTDPADGVSIGVIIFVWFFDLGVFVLPAFLLGRRLRRYKKAARWRETEYLLRNPGNAAALPRSIAELTRGEARERGRVEPTAGEDVA
jgi:hypothetical protein